MTFCDWMSGKMEIKIKCWRENKLKKEEKQRIKIDKIKKKCWFEEEESSDGRKEWNKSIWINIKTKLSESEKEKRVKGCEKKGEKKITTIKKGRSKSWRKRRKNDNGEEEEEKWLTGE